MSDLLYLYGVTAPPPGEARLPAGAQLLRQGDLCALCAPVPAAEFGDTAALELRLHDPAYLVPLAQQHEATLQAMQAQATVLPARLCTLFSSEAALRAMLAAEAPHLRERLARVAGRAEYALKLSCDLARLRATLAAGLAGADQDDAALSPGLRYLAQRRREEAAAAAAEERIEEICAALYDDISPCADAVQERAPLTGGPKGAQPLNVLNLALLCSPASLEALDALCAAQAPGLLAQGFLLQRSGPFTPYSFAAADPVPS